MFKKKEKEPKKEWDGNGEGIWANIRRWYYTRFKGYVILREYSQRWSPKDMNDPEFDFDEPYDCDIKLSLIKKKDLPPEAVHCTGEPYTFSVDKAHIRYELHDEGFRATDAWLFLEFNGFDDCLAKNWTSYDHISMGKVLLIGGLVIAGLIVFVIWRVA